MPDASIGEKVLNALKDPSFENFPIYFVIAATIMAISAFTYAAMPKKKVEGKLLDVLKTNDKNEGCFNGIRLLTSKGPIKSATLANASVQ